MCVTRIEQNTILECARWKGSREKRRRESFWVWVVTKKKKAGESKQKIQLEWDIVHFLSDKKTVARGSAHRQVCPRLQIVQLFPEKTHIYIRRKKQAFFYSHYSYLPGNSGKCLLEKGWLAFFSLMVILWSAMHTFPIHFSKPLSCRFFSSACYTDLENWYSSRNVEVSNADSSKLK